VHCRFLFVKTNLFDNQEISTISDTITDRICTCEVYLGLMNVVKDPEIRIISPGAPWWSFGWAEVWNYRHLLKFLLLRDIRLVYKQTILGPVHLFLRPIIMTIVFQLVFNELGKMSTDGIHPFLFYYGNSTVWTFFSGIFGTASGIFMTGRGLMAKVYFPRIIPVFSSVMMNGVKFSIQILFLAFLFVYFAFSGGGNTPSPWCFGIVLAIFQVAIVALGFGLLFACVTLRYRDLNSLSGVIVQGMMYLSPVIFPFTSIPEKYQFLASFNPLSSAMESFRFFLFGQGSMSVELLVIGWSVSLSVLFTGLVSFNLTQRKFVDIV